MSGDEVHTISICPRGFQLAELARGHNISAQTAPCYCPQPKAPARPAAGDAMSDRERLREALADILYDRENEVAAGDADALMPTVLAFAEAQGRRRAAEELRRAGEDFRRTTLPGPWSSAEVAYEMDARAAALAPENARPE